MSLMNLTAIASPRAARLGFGRLRPLSCFALVLVPALMLLAPSFAQAQKKYFPDHPDVKKMCDKAMNVLAKSEAIAPGSRGSGAAALRALAIIQYHKRYNQRVPKDHPYVERAVEHVLGEFPKGGESNKKSIIDEAEMYYPCLAMILLAEYDAQKYKSQIKTILKMIKDRQLSHGGHSYKHEPQNGDTSQTQFVALALSVAKTHGFNFNVEVAQRSLDWFVKSQKPNGNWVYKPNFANNPNGKDGGPPSLSMQAAGASSVYLLADVLQLFKRVKSLDKTLSGSEGLPGNVRIHVKPVDDDEGQAFRGQGPLAKFDRGRLSGATNKGNATMARMFSPKSSSWQYYYLYAVERYAYFREQAEGNLKGMDDWYDRTIEFMKKSQANDGGFPPLGTKTEKTPIGTAFAVLVMVRSSEVINLPPTGSELKGGEGFKSDTVLRQGKNGEIKSLEAEKNLADTLELMKAGATDEQLREVAQTLKKQIVEFRTKSDKSRGKTNAFLRSMVKANNYYRRLIAVRFLAGEQDMDNVPALIYALGDPDFRIAIEAHDGLRLISRKIDSLTVSSRTRTNAKRPLKVLSGEEKSLLVSEFALVKKNWTDWFLKIRPGAELFD